MKKPAAAGTVKAVDPKKPAKPAKAAKAAKQTGPPGPARPIKQVRPAKTAKTAKAAAGKPAAAGSGAGNAAGSGADVLDRLYATIMERRTADPARSHSARLLSRGPAKVAQKFGEEAVECLIEAVANNPAALIDESADVLYHLLVMWVAAGVSADQVWSELRHREGVSGVDEKASRTTTAKIP